MSGGCPYCTSEWIREAFLRISELTDRELEVFTEMAGGPTNQQLAHCLGMSIRTVKFHLENLRGKLGGLSRIQTCLLAVHHRIDSCPAEHA